MTPNERAAEAISVRTIIEKLGGRFSADPGGLRLLMPPGQDLPLRLMDRLSLVVAAVGALVEAEQIVHEIDAVSVRRPRPPTLGELRRADQREEETPS